MKNIQSFRNLMRSIVVIIDLINAPLVYFLSYWIRSKSTLFFFQGKMPLDRYYWITHHLWLLVVLHIILLYFHGLYDRQHLLGKNQIISRIIRSVSLTILILVAVYFFRLDILFPRSIFLLLWILLILTTSVIHVFFSELYREQIPRRNLLIVGISKTTEVLLQEIERLPSYRLNVAGLLVANKTQDTPTEFMGYPILGSRDELLRIVNERDIHEVVISSASSWQDCLIDQISRIEQIPARISIIPTCYEILIGKIKHLRMYDMPLIEVIKHPQPPVGKRFIDFSTSLLLFMLTLPLMIATALIIRFTSGSPILFKQTRLGKNRIPFTMYKFRTLVQGAEKETGPVLTATEDTRITRIGRILRKYRFDELPQLLNIIKGEMSFVGPRPERPFFVKQFMDRIPGYGERFKASPGITGLAQVNGGYDTIPENKLKYDLAYIYNQSLWLDFQIMLETIKVILTGQVNP